MTVRFVFNSKFVKLFKSNAITLYPFVFVAEDKQTAFKSKIISHELIHVRQIRKQGFFKFYGQYLLDFLSNYLITKNFWYSYYNVPAEYEAYRHENDKELLSDAQTVLLTDKI